MIGTFVARNCSGLTHNTHKGQNIVKSTTVILNQKRLTVLGSGVYYSRLPSKISGKTKLSLCANCDGAGWADRAVVGISVSLHMKRLVSLKTIEISEEVGWNISNSHHFLVTRLL